MDEYATTTDTDEAPVRAPRSVHDLVEAIEGSSALDRYGGVLARVSEQLTQGSRGPFLRGEWLGHALHPVLTDLPLGCWVSAGILDLVGGRGARKASQRLVAIGLVSVPLTAAAGLADWRTIESPEPRRVGIAHALGNAAVAGCYLRSWSSRRHGRHLRGVAWGVAGGGMAMVTGYLGGHLSFARGIGVGERGSSTAPIDLTEATPPSDATAPVERTGRPPTETIVSGNSLHL
jgi:uncharacterized membrane protein